MGVQKVCLRCTYFSLGCARCHVALIVERNDPAGVRAQRERDGAHGVRHARELPSRISCS